MDGVRLDLPDVYALRAIPSSAPIIKPITSKGLRIHHGLAASIPAGVKRGSDE